MPPEDRKSYETLVFNAYGAPAFRGAKNSIWPIQVMLNEIAPQNRYDDLIVAGLWFGKSKPDMDILMRELSKQINKSFSQSIPCTIQNEKIN